MRRPGDGGRSLGRPQRVAVVDDDDLQRAGLVAVLGRDDDVGAVEEDTIASALDRSGWAGVDIVVVHLSTAMSRGGRLRGVEVIEQLRQQQVPRPPQVVALGTIPHDSAARLRARLAGADAYVHRWWHRSEADLRDALLRPGPREVP